MRVNLNKNILILILIFLAALGLRLYQLSFFEYHYDQYFAIILGNQARAAHFLITHGMCSGLGLDNPPLFADFMGLLTSLSNDPAVLTFYFFSINLLALALALIYFYRTLPGPYAILSAAFLSLFPAFTIYSNNIWAQCMLPIMMILFNISFYRFVKHEQWSNFFYMTLLATIAAQFHGSGFLLFPLLVILAIVYWNKIDKRFILLSIFITILLFIPYLIHLFKDDEIAKVMHFGSSTNRSFQWKVLPSHFRMASFEFFRGYFKPDFNAMLKAACGGWSHVLYPLTFIPGVLFIIGFLDYLKWLSRGKIFDTTEKEHPLAFQISGHILLIVTMGYMALRIPTSMHYCIVFFPAYSIFSASTASKIWPHSWGKIIVSLGILSTFVLLIGVLLFLNRAGGHPYEYGISYKNMLSWQQKLGVMKQAGECFDLKIHFDAKDTSDVESTHSVLTKNNTCNPNDKIIPAQINFIWNNKLMRYEELFFKRRI